LLDVMKLVLKGVTPNPWTAIGWFGKKYIGIVGKWLRLNTCSWPLGFELGPRGNLSNTKLLSKRTWDDLEDPTDPEQVNFFKKCGLKILGFQRLARWLKCGHGDGDMF